MTEARVKLQMVLRRPWAGAVGLYAVLAAAATVMARLGAGTPSLAEPNVDFGPYTGSWLLGGWNRFDAGWYRAIAEEGYWYNGPDVQSAVAFFPGYPLLLRALHAVTGLDVRLLGSVVTILAGLGATLLFLWWARSRVDAPVAWAALVTFLLYPYAFYLFGAVYADALFLFATLSAFLLLEHDHPVLAGLMGAVATATRPLGVAVVVGLVAVTLFRREVITRTDGRLRIDLRRLRPADPGVLLSVTGVVAFMVFLQRAFGNPLAFQEVQQAPGWDQGSGPRTWFKLTWFQHMRRLPERTIGWLQGEPGYELHMVQYALTVILQGALVLGCVWLAVRVWRRFGWGYGLFCASALAIALIGTKDFQGTGRYLLMLFPCFVVLAELLMTRPRLRWAWWGVSVSLLLVWAFAFGRDYYVA